VAADVAGAAGDENSHSQLSVVSCQWSVVSGQLLVATNH
jgi:hypothetical protein